MLSEQPFIGKAEVQFRISNNDVIAQRNVQDPTGAGTLQPDVILPKVNGRAYLCIMEGAQTKLVNCPGCSRSIVIPVSPVEDHDIICMCGELNYWSDFGVCEPSYVLILAPPPCLN